MHLHTGLTCCPETQAKKALEALNVTSRSVLGALTLNTGGLLVDHGWLRLLGSGHHALAGIHEANQLSGMEPPTGVLLVGHDVIGGRFGISDGSLPGSPGEVHYWGPDTLRWDPLGFGHGAFVEFALSDALSPFYESLRWTGWQSEIEKADGNHGIFVYPPPFSLEGKDLSRAARNIVPWSELVSFFDEAARQLGQPDIDQSRIR